MTTATLGQFRGGFIDHRAEVHRTGCGDLGKTARRYGFGWVESTHADAASAVAAYLDDDPDGLASRDEVRIFPCAARSSE